MTQNQLIAPPASAPALELHPLSDLLPGQEAVVSKLVAKGAIRQRLLEMGFVRGAKLKVVKLAPLGDPMQLLIKGYQLSLRRDESSCILVETQAPASLAPRP